MKKVTITTCFLFMLLTAMANNVNLSNISLIGSPGNYRVKFDLAWDNSWRVSTGQNNYDGVWVFFKFRTNGGDWQHLTMTGIGNLIPANYTAYQNTGAVKTGAIIHRSNDFIGTSTLTNIELGINDPSFGVDIRGFAIEMVFIPQCTNCIIGDGNGTFESTNAFHVANNTSGALGSTFTVDVNTFDDIVAEGGLAINAAGITANASFPTGQAFWSMKYELSQGAYRDFLNTLNNIAQQTTRTAFAPGSTVGTGALIASGSFRNFIEIAVPGALQPAVYGCDANGNNIFDEAADGEWVACNFLSWADNAAYLDWAGLAPMTEVMYERICRGASSAGVNPSVFGEYAWGNSNSFTGHTLSAAFTASEFSSNASVTLGNANASSSAGPFRNGLFATGATNRSTSGSSFYGVMEMTGNLIEPCITVGNTAGRAFTGINGNGLLNINGNADVANWPCSTSPSVVPSCSEVLSAAGVIPRGGHFSNILFPVSARDNSFPPYEITNRASGQGCRGALYIN